ncbi:hypothetical protein RR46_06519 [Papilio xuthus]|uniref:C2H2-type domain-containing protein n=1 Tax=Papilio xuthus TaxID=66420 RepID=A0A194QCU5_PAPXU|nr:hypothetical protein RR46_06519 [Papilio xuthus]
MIANLPLLFANGNPIAISTISASQLEKFITFMVTCSWGHDTAKDIRQPPWWPEDVEFSHPFVKPEQVPQDWETRLKNLVRRCYNHHKSAFLLVFSAHLARLPRKRLRLVDNRDHTTSMYYRPSGRLLVTFRNENLFYDREESVEKEESHVKSADIYLCDNCDSHFDNLHTLQAHERLCNNEIPTTTCNGGLAEFMSALKLQSTKQIAHGASSNNINIDTKPKNSRSAANVDRGPPFPFSSLAYMRNAKTNVQRDSTYSRERFERFCCTTTPLNKNVVSKSRNQFPIRYRRPIDYWHRTHIFPNQRNKKLLDVKGQLLYLKCRPVSVKVERMSLKSMTDYIKKLKEESESKMYVVDKDIVYVDGFDSDHAAEADVRSADPLKRLDNDCEVIDLCSDDEGPSGNENCDPRAGITCVMRGGAVLRRAAATPNALPAEPCGARQRPLPAIQHLPSAVLQPHPVILIAHTLNNLQTITLE